MIIAAAIFCVCAAWFFIRWNFAGAVAMRIDPAAAESKSIAAWLTDLAPADPQTHISAGRVLEKTFDSGDLASAVIEYEKAVDLSPHNYLVWLDLGRARSMSGDTTSAHSAYEQAHRLAPNYAAVQWVYGNSLVRQGSTDEGFTMIAIAAAGNAEYAQSAAALVLQIFDGDLAAARRAVGDGAIIDGAFANVLSNQKRFDEAAEAWSRFHAADKPDVFPTLGSDLVGRFADAKRFHQAAAIAADIRSESEKPKVGVISNGGFENEIKLRNAPIFEWQVADGAQPQIGIGEGQAHGGKFNLSIAFNTFEASVFRSVSQTVAVVPGAAYQFEMFYRSDLKTVAVLKWEIVDAANSDVIAATPPLTNATDWTASTVNFTMPGGSDGIIIRLAREGCGGPTCPANGRLSFDDFSLRQILK